MYMNYYLVLVERGNPHMMRTHLLRMLSTHDWKRNNPKTKKSTSYQGNAKCEDWPTDGIRKLLSVRTVRAF